MPSLILAGLLSLDLHVIAWIPQPYAKPPPKVPIHDNIWFADGRKPDISTNGKGDGAKYFANCNNGLLYPTMLNTITCRPGPGAGSIRLAMMVKAAAGAWLIM